MLIRILFIAIIFGGLIWAQNSNEGDIYRSQQDIANQAFDTSKQAYRTTPVQGGDTLIVKLGASSGNFWGTDSTDISADTVFHITPSFKMKRLTVANMGVSGDTLFVSPYSDFRSHSVVILTYAVACSMDIAWNTVYAKYGHTPTAGKPYLIWIR